MYKHKEEYLEVEESLHANDEYLTEQDLQFIENPTIKVTFGINNKKEYIDSDNIYDYIAKIREENHNRVDSQGENHCEEENE